MKVGLTLGKYAPLHRGHQLVIETALAETDHVIVIIYDAPEQTTCPLPVRTNWLRRLYPTVAVIEAWDGPTVVGDSPEIQRLHEHYLHTILDGCKVTHFYSSEFYGAHVSRALAAIDRRVDPARETIPVSATAIRHDPYAHRSYLEPIVYRDLITRIVFLGAPCTGKTTLAQRLAHAYDTTWVPEYGREYWEKHQIQRRLSLQQLVEIAEGHRQREDERTMDARRWLFIDTDATTTAIFSDYYHGEMHPRLAELAVATLGRYDLFFLCEDDIPYDDTPDRSGEGNRALFQKKIRADLLARGIPFISLRGTLARRCTTVAEVLERFDKFDSVTNNLLDRG